MDYQYFGLLATILLICGLAYVPYKWPLNRHKTFSQHVALKRSSVMYYSLLFSVVLPILIIFFIKWFTPHFGITLWLNGFVVLSAVFQIACTLVPEKGGKMTDWHQALAGLSALLLLPALVVLLTSSAITAASKVISVLALCVMITTIYIVIRAKGKPNNFLLIQCTYFSAFLLPIMYISYFQ